MRAFLALFRRSQQSEPTISDLSTPRKVFVRYTWHHPKMAAQKASMQLVVQGWPGAPRGGSDGGVVMGAESGETVGDLIRARRGARRVTLAKLAEEVGCAKSYLSLIE